MPLYAAYFGDANQLPVPEEGSFCLRDVFGRDWTCREVGEEESVELAAEMMLVHERLRRKALDREGSHLHVGEYGSAEALRAALGQAVS